MPPPSSASTTRAGSSGQGREQRQGEAGGAARRTPREQGRRLGVRRAPRRPVPALDRAGRARQTPAGPGPQGGGPDARAERAGPVRRRALEEPGHGRVPRDQAGPVAHDEDGHQQVGVLAHRRRRRHPPLGRLGHRQEADGRGQLVVHAGRVRAEPLVGPGPGLGHQRLGDQHRLGLAPPAEQDRLGRGQRDRLARRAHPPGRLEAGGRELEGRPARPRLGQQLAARRTREGDEPGQAVARRARVSLPSRWRARQHAEGRAEIACRRMVHSVLSRRGLPRMRPSVSLP